ncbi:MAG: nucleotidyltransferase domain-containing protein [Clostridia bacterium]|nr:nucleotidyltransferase domain-containing protein [Clostridia bacterium]
MTNKVVNKDIVEIIKKYINEISKKFEVKSVYLFGSYAKGTNHNDSDIDIAVILESEEDTIDLMVELMMLTQNIDLRIEPHPIKNEDFEEGNPFIDEIKNTGLKVA